MTKLLWTVRVVIGAGLIALASSTGATASGSPTGCHGSKITNVKRSQAVRATAHAAETAGFRVARQSRRMDLENPYYVVQFGFKSEICGEVGVTLKLKLSSSHSVPLFLESEFVTAGHRTDIVMTASNAQASKAVTHALMATKPLTLTLVTRARPSGSHTSLVRSRKFTVS